MKMFASLFHNLPQKIYTILSRFITNSAFFVANHVSKSLLEFVRGLFSA